MARKVLTPSFAQSNKDGPATSIGLNADLPAAAFSKDGLFVAYVSKVKEKRSVWLIKADHSVH